MLQGHLNAISDEIWERLKDAKQLRISQGEETITDNILLYLFRQHIGVIRIVPTPKNKEKFQGTDWEWWIGNNRDGWLRYAIQAKKLNQQTNKYESLNHQVGKKPNQQSQHRILETYATANHAIPLYAFYNHIDLDDYTPYWHCSNMLDVKKLGCTVTPLKNVKNALSTRGSRTFQTIHSFEETIPIRCLAICPSIYGACKGINSRFHLEKLGIDATIFQNIDLFNEPINDFKQLPNSLYNHEIALYPKRILIIKTQDGI